MSKIILIILIALTLDAKVIIKPRDAMQFVFGKEIKVSKKNIMLKKQQAKKIQKIAKVKFKSKIFRVFIATKDKKTVGYGVLINRKVRSKNAVVLYMIDDKSTLKSIEIIAFNEPMEYLPSKKWKEQFIDVDVTTQLKVSKNISTITGATLSARTITDGSRLAFAFYNEVLK